MAPIGARRIDFDELDASLTDEDEEQLHAVGIDRSTVRAQLALLGGRPPTVELDRACQAGDGIETLDAARAVALLEAHRRAAVSGRITQFVPASGGASRLFDDLVAVRARYPELDDAVLERLRTAPAGDERVCLEFLAHVDRFAFSGLLRTRMLASDLDLDAILAGGDRALLLEQLLTERGLGFGALPKGLVPFHCYADGSRTAIEEHLVEALASVAGLGVVPKVHVTVASAHRRRMVQHLEAAAARLACDGRGPRIETSVSVQSPSTATLGVDGHGQPRRDATGRLMLWPGGHGALLSNLEALGGDVVFLRNVDNIGPDWLRDASVHWQRLLIGRLVELEATVRVQLSRLDRATVGGAELEAMEHFAARELGLAALACGPRPVGDAARCRRLARALARPLRVCGVVPATGEPGGAPVWVRAADGMLSVQIVEATQVDRNDSEQQRRFRTAPYLNPVFMACAMRDHRGAAHRLAAFADPGACMVASKTVDGSPVRVLEQPGLWNGGMAGWNTVLVEVPDSVFAPVKTVLDLLGPAHRSHA
ncbi:MAG: DUF4301 family protein [Candidatus Eiseniibacteriota bacterium]|jgi:hypothetical protein